MKVCSSCKIEKDLDQFGKRARSPCGLAASCKVCISSRRKFYQSQKDYQKRRYWENKESNLKKVRDWYQSNPGKKAEHHKTYRNKNLEEVRYKERLKELERLKRVPSWLSEGQKEEIRNLYKLRDELQILSGDTYHVDHIVPLQGALVSGLHVPWNLQILPADLNLKKGNKNGETGFSANTGGMPQ